MFYLPLLPLNHANIDRETGVYDEDGGDSIRDSIRHMHHHHHHDECEGKRVGTDNRHERK